MGNHDQQSIRFAEGTGRNFGRAKNKSLEWGAFKQRLRTPIKTDEKFSQYMEMPKVDQDTLKSIGGWIYRTQVNGPKRTAKSGKPSDLITLDIDYGDPVWLEELKLGLVCHQIEYFAHSTRRHTSDAPRMRIWIPVARPIVSEEYGAVSRIVAQMFDPEMRQVDKVSFRLAQMMFLPTISADAEFVIVENFGRLLDPDGVLDAFSKDVGDWRILSNLPKVDGEELRQHAEKAEDPTTKVGPVGDFCRAYTVPEAMDRWIPGTYEPTDENSAKPRYTYLGGTTTSGAVTHEGGLFLYSHHSSDPCFDRLVNAFEMVRIHKFCDLDADVEKGTPGNRLPSYRAMLDLIADDPLYKTQQAKSLYDMEAMFTDDGDTEPSDDELEEDMLNDIEDLVGSPGSYESEAGTETATDTDGSETRTADDVMRAARRKREAPKDWFPGELQLDRAGNIRQEIYNAQIIVHNDKRLFGKIGYDDFLKRIVLLGDIKSRMGHVPPITCPDKVRGVIWQDHMDLTIRSILAAPNGTGKAGYGLSKLAERDLSGAVEMAARRNLFHPIKDYLNACRALHPEAGAKARECLDTLMIRYLGVPDTPYHRDVARLVMIASVARIMEPGHKFDFAPVLQGDQGIRKSSFIETLYGHEYFGELTCNLRDTQKIAEVIGGIWGMEFPELASFYKSDHNDAKQFLSAKEDRVRMAYDRRVSHFPRQATFWGTTNDRKYLKDPTGNRRWWPLIVGAATIDTDSLAVERDRLWATAYTLYLEMREARPRGPLPLYLANPASAAEAKCLQEEARTEQLAEMYAETLTNWLDTPVTLAHWRSEMMSRETTLPDPGEADPGDIMVRRVVYSREDALRVLGIDDLKTEVIAQNVVKAMSLITGWRKVPGNAQRRWGRQLRWHIRTAATAIDLNNGYEVVSPESDLGIDDLV